VFKGKKYNTNIYLAKEELFSGKNRRISVRAMQQEQRSAQNGFLAGYSTAMAEKAGQKVYIMGFRGSFANTCVNEMAVKHPFPKKIRLSPANNNCNFCFDSGVGDLGISAGPPCRDGRRVRRRTGGMAAAMRGEAEQGDRGR
jgi:hypothetical protein